MTGLWTTLCVYDGCHHYTTMDQFLTDKESCNCSTPIVIEKAEIYTRRKSYKKVISPKSKFILLGVSGKYLDEWIKHDDKFFVFNKSQIIKLELIFGLDLFTSNFFQKIKEFQKKYLFFCQNARKLFFFWLETENFFVQNIDVEINYFSQCEPKRCGCDFVYHQVLEKMIVCFCSPRKFVELCNMYFVQVNIYYNTQIKTSKFYEHVVLKLNSPKIYMFKPECEFSPWNNSYASVKLIYLLQAPWKKYKSYIHVDKIGWYVKNVD